MKKTAKPKKRKSHWSDKMFKWGACPEGLKFARRYKTFAEAWAACEDTNWMRWYIQARYTEVYCAFGGEYFESLTPVVVRASTPKAP